jgi:hypothetical protein
LAPCYVADPDKSAGCQEGLFSNILNDTGASTRGNFSRGGYPPVYYAAIGQFTTLDVQASVLTMRLVNIGVFLAFTVSLFWLLPRRLKPVLVGGWLITTVPLGLFIITSVNPGSWALTGVVSSWIALLGWFESAGRRKIALGFSHSPSLSRPGHAETQQCSRASEWCSPPYLPIDMIDGFGLTLFCPSLWGSSR